MPIQIPNDLPAAGILQQENIFVMRKTRAETQHIRPLEIVLLNLMPTKIVTETQLSRLLGNTPLQVHLELMMVSSHRSKNTPQEHLLNFYKTFDELKDRKFDGMVITGAPVEQMPFEEVDYWPELCQIMEWSKTNVHSTFHICWGAQAGLYYHYGIQKKALPEKLFGVYPHHADYKRAILLRGFDDEFWIPHSRHTTVERARYRGCSRPENSGFLSGRRSLRRHEQGRPSDFRHRPRRVRCGHAGKGIPPGQSAGSAHPRPSELLSQRR